MEKEPLDLLGPTHQRLIMHCLSEVSTEMPLRENLERNLSQWLLFECSFKSTTDLASEVEFPEQPLYDVLQQGTAHVKQAILETLGRRPIIPLTLLN